jgi:hypothetical protein
MAQFQNKSTWGGERPNSGRKRKYGEVTKIVSVRVPLSEVTNVKKLVKKYLNSI